MSSNAVCRKPADHATRHFLHQRITAVLLIPLSLWMLVFFNKAMSASYADTVSWLVSPVNVLAVMAWTILVIYHAALGVQVVLEDYVSTIPVRIAAIFISNFIFLILGVVALSAVVFILYTQGNHGLYV